MTTSLTPDEKLGIARQCEEFLFYKKKHLRDVVAARIQTRCKQIDAGGIVDSHAYAAQVAAQEAAALSVPPPPAPPPPASSVPQKQKKNASQHATHNFPTHITQLNDKSPVHPTKRSSNKCATQMPSAKRASPDRAPAIAGHSPVPIPTASYVNHVTRRIPKTIEDEWHRLTSVSLGVMPNTPRCMCPHCPFTTGPPMRQRYHVMLALINLETYMWGV